MGSTPHDVLRRMNLPGGAGDTDLSYDELVASFLPPFWYKFKETSGTTVLNYGTAGAAANGVWTAGAGALGQTGKLGANEAYDNDGLVSKIVIPDIAAIQALATYTIIGLCKADAAGENNAGTILHLGVGAAAAFRRTGVNNQWNMGFDTDTTDAVTSTEVNFAPDATWLAMFGTYDNAGDRKCRIYKGVGGAVVESNYAGGQTAATGTRVTPNGATIGNYTDVRTFDGLIDEVIVCDRVLSAGQMLAYTLAAGLTS